MRRLRSLILAGIVTAALVGISACKPGVHPMNQAELHDLATRYAAAWSSRDPAAFARFYAERGVLRVNGGPPSVGREAVKATAQSYMTAFPDMVVRLDSLTHEADQTIFHWTWTGTNTGPGGTGRSVRLSGYERWSLDADGLIAESQGHFDEAAYRRQVNGG